MSFNSVKKTSRGRDRRTSQDTWNDFEQKTGTRTRGVLLANSPVPHTSWTKKELYPMALFEPCSFAISMGGDTDTIATMTGSIAGAYYGIFRVPTTMQGYCQAEEYATYLGNRLLMERWQPK
ncbi:hypothetical protein MRX96_035260 [Rhipicephalus microplus]